MEPMNKFITMATTEFKDFIEEICSYDSSKPSILHEAQYQAPAQIKARLPSVSREGLPSLPYLLDSPKLCGMLIDIWIDHAPTHLSDTGIDDCVQSFHELCQRLKRRTKECMVRAEGAAEPDSNLEKQWQLMLSGQPKQGTSGSGSEEHYGESVTGVDAVAAPQNQDETHLTTRFPYTEPLEMGIETTDHALPFPPQQTGESRRVVQNNHRSTEAHRAFTNSTNSSTISLEGGEDSRNRPVPSSRDGSSKKKFLELSARKRGK